MLGLDEKVEFKQALAKQAGVEPSQVTDVSIRELLDEIPKGSDKLKMDIEAKYNKLDALRKQYNDFEKEIKKGYVNKDIPGIDEEIAKQRSALRYPMGRLERDLAGDIRKLAGQQSLGLRAANAFSNLTRFRKANMLLGVPSTERNLTQDVLGTINYALKNPGRFLSSLTSSVGGFKAAARSSMDSWKVPPKTVSEIPAYIIGNLYETIMTPVTGVANMRRAAAREAVAETVLRTHGLEVTPASVKGLAGAMGNESELIVNTMIGVDNGMSSLQQLERVKKDWIEWSKTGSSASKRAWLDNVQKQTNLAKVLTSELHKKGGGR